MAKLNLSVAMGDYDRTRPLSDGAVQIDGVDPVFMTCRRRKYSSAPSASEFDICELSLSSFTVKTAHGDCPYVGVPAFRSRTFRHTSIYVRTDRHQKPQDLKGKRSACRNISSPPMSGRARSSRTTTASSRPTSTGCAAGIERAGPARKRSPSICRRTCGSRTRREGKPCRRMLEAGEIDGFIGPRVPPAFERGDPNVGWLFPDPVAAAKDYYKRTGIFPIMHLIGVRRDAGGAASLAAGGGVQGVRAGEGDGAGKAQRHVGDQSDAAVRRGAAAGSARADGRGFLALRRGANRKMLETFLRHHHAQGLSPRLVKVEEMFHPGTLETYKL